MECFMTWQNIASLLSKADQKVSLIQIPMVTESGSLSDLHRIWTCDCKSLEQALYHYATDDSNPKLYHPLNPMVSTLGHNLAIVCQNAFYWVILQILFLSLLLISTQDRCSYCLCFLKAKGFPAALFWYFCWW